MDAPARPHSKIHATPSGTTITVFAFTFSGYQMKKILSERGIHTLEHLFAGFMRKPPKTVMAIEISLDHLSNGLPHWFLHELESATFRRQSSNVLEVCHEDVLKSKKPKNKRISRH